jgi:hypothetical protein
MSDLLHISDFSPYLNQTFQLHFSHEIVLPAELIDATSLNNSYSPAERPPFTLVFRTPQKDSYYPQMTVVLKHPEKGDLPIFIVPLGPDQDGMKYEAVFT